MQPRRAGEMEELAGPPPSNSEASVMWGSDLEALPQELKERSLTSSVHVAMFIIGYCAPLQKWSPANFGGYRRAIRPWNVDPMFFSTQFFHGVENPPKVV